MWGDYNIHVHMWGDYNIHVHMWGHFHLNNNIQEQKTKVDTKVIKASFI